MPSNQVGTVTSDLGPVGAAKEGFSLYYLETTEDLGRPFRFEATLLADEDIGDKIQSLLGTDMCCAIGKPTGIQWLSWQKGALSGCLETVDLVPQT